MNKDAKRFRIFGFEDTKSQNQYDILGGEVSRDNAIMLRLAPLSGEVVIDALDVGTQTWCRSVIDTPDTSKKYARRKREVSNRKPAPDRYVVERVA